ncbi:MAG: hypothetical protein FWF97_03795 [Alphaproteobacteria bacterium]|nr:hypothetical protein [Alphaproteobacteria bacterium]
MKNITIIDGHDWLYRAFYVVPTAAATRGGTMVNALYGFMMFLRQTTAMHPNNEVLIVFDAEAEQKSLARDRPILKQLPLIKKLLDLIGIKWIQDEKNRGIDVIASMTAKWKGTGAKVFIASNNYDFVQFISDKVTMIYDFHGFLNDFDARDVVEKFGVKPAQFIDFKALDGTRTHKMPGVPGMGIKNAAALMEKYKTVANLYKHLNELPPAAAATLMAAKPVVAKNQKTLAMRTDVKFSGGPGKVSAKALNEKMSIMLHRAGIK